MDKIGFIGCGHMGEAMLAGCLQAGLCQPADLLVHSADLSADRRLNEIYGVFTAVDNRSLAKAAKYLILAVKPQVYQSVITEIRPVVTTEHVIISISPSWTIDLMAETLAKENLKLVHAIPNTPAMVGSSMTGLCFGDHLTAAEKETVLSFFQSFGLAAEITADLVPAVLATSSSSPAYVYMLIEALVQGGIEQGLRADQATLFAAKTVEGAARMVLKTKKHPAELREAVCSPAGTTIAGVATLEKAGFNGMVMAAMEASVRRLREM